MQQTREGSDRRYGGRGVRREGGSSRGVGNRRNDNEQVNPNLFKQSPEYYKKYLEHIKLSKMWSNNGQYLMASEEFKRAKCLELGNVKAYEHYTPPEQLYMSTRKNKYSEYVKNEGAIVDVSHETCPARKWPTIC